MDDYPTFYALKAGPDKWCVFGSFVVSAGRYDVKFVDSPFKATWFQNPETARKRADRAHKHISDSWREPEWIGPGEFAIMEIAILQYEEDDIS